MAVEIINQRRVPPVELSLHLSDRTLIDTLDVGDTVAVAIDEGYVQVSGNYRIIRWELDCETDTLTVTRRPPREHMMRPPQPTTLDSAVRSLAVRVARLERARPSVASTVEDAGAGGARILHGEGPPPVTLGQLGDYYLDTLNHNLYGPKTSAPIGEQTLEIEDIGFEDAEVDGHFGPRIEFDSDGFITEVAYRREATNDDTLRIAVWDDTFSSAAVSRLDYVDDDRPGQTGEFTVTFASPIRIESGHWYTFTLGGDPSTAVFPAGGAPDVTNTANMTFLGWRGDNSSINDYPGTVFNAGGYVMPTFSEGYGGYWPVAVWGVPLGGATAETLAKASSNDFDIDWT